MVDTGIGTSPVKQIGKYTWEEYLDRVAAFHSYKSPGVLIGGIMVETAVKCLPDGVLFEAICETSSCLPDSIQLLTPCTIGNGWLRIVNLGRYALSLYDKYKGNGIRIYLDVNKLEGWEEIQSWFLKLKSKREQDAGRLIEQIRAAGQSIYTLHSVQIKSLYLSKHSKGPIGICTICGEAFPTKDGGFCLGCQGEAPYDNPVYLRHVDL